VISNRIIYIIYHKYGLSLGHKYIIMGMYCGTSFTQKYKPVLKTQMYAKWGEAPFCTVLEFRIMFITSCVTNITR
jgi:hypothetical protein